MKRSSLGLRAGRWVFLALFDASCWVAAFTMMGAMSGLTGAGLADGPQNAVWVGLGCATLHVLIGVTVKLHQGRAPLASFEDALSLVTVVGLVGLGLMITDLALGPFYRFSVAIASPIIALTLMLWGRGIYRVWRDRQGADRMGSIDRRPVVIIGAGEGAAQLVRSMSRDVRSPWRPVALVDDDRLKRYRRIRGIPVKGRVLDFADVADAVGARTAILAIPSASRELARQLNTLATESGLELKVVPSTSELVNPSKVAISDVRDLDVTDLLGRHQIDTDLSSIAGYLTGRRVLVTGAGGSIGSELCRQIAAFSPAELMMLDRDESALHAVQLSIHGKALLDSDETILADIRDPAVVFGVFERRLPEVVFHAAALKHLPLLEGAPGEAIKTNVWGTQTILEAAAKAGVEKFVNISTDKAADPCSALGYTKRLAEGLTSSMAQSADGTYLSVRFGNVLGSRGSVLTSFAAQIAAGGPVTVTDPGATRYFMTIKEAVQLVVQAAAIGRDGEALVLDMGDPVSIDSVARQLIELADEDIAIEYTGLRPGEKLHEQLFGAGEVDERRLHPLISHTPVPAYDPLDARGLDPWADVDGIASDLMHACGEMRAKFAEGRSS